MLVSLWGWVTGDLNLGFFHRVLARIRILPWARWRLSLSLGVKCLQLSGKKLLRQGTRPHLTSNGSYFEASPLGVSVVALSFKVYWRRGPSNPTPFIFSLFPLSPLLPWPYNGGLYQTHKFQAICSMEWLFVPKIPRRWLQQTLITSFI